MKSFLSLALSAIMLLGAVPAFAGGNELMYTKAQSLTTLAPETVDPAADYTVVFDASAGVMKKVLATSSLRTQVASTTTAITASQCGSTFVSNSADVMTLPEASTVLGCRLTFVCGTADDFDINPADGTDQITSVSTTNGTTGVVTLAPSAGDAIRCTDIGGSITLEAIGANAWSQVGGGNGIWTDVN